MTAQRVFILIFIVYLLGFLGHALYLQKTVYGDGIYYYSWLRSVVIDHDVHFQNEYAYFHVQQPLTKEQVPANKYSVGPALFWLPTYLWNQQIIHGNGYQLWYQLSVGLASAFFVFIGLLLLFRLLDSYFPHPVSIATIASIAFATNLFFYGSLDTVNSHGLSFFAACVYLSLVFAKEKKFFYIGIALGILGIIRMQDLIYGILVLPFIRWKHILPIVTGFLAIFSVQLIAWQMVYGTFWINPYLAGSEGFTLTHPHILEVLFSFHNGLFLWTPILFLGLIGLVVSSFTSAKANRYTMFLFVMLLQIWVVASWSTWWQGASYSGRMFVSILPVLAFGIAEVYAWLKKYHWTAQYYIVCIIAPLSIINFLLMIFFLFHKQTI